MELIRPRRFTKSADQDHGETSDGHRGDAHSSFKPCIIEKRRLGETTSMTSYYL